jgi:germination protein M
MLRASLLAVLASLLLVGCGGGAGDAGETTTTTPETIELKVYLIRDGQLWPARRVVPYTESVERAALDELLEGPTDQEFEELGFRHAIQLGVDFQGLVVEDGVARIEVTDELREDGLGQLVYTLTQFPGVQSVEVVGNVSTRALERLDFEEFTPAILVESPLAFEEVTSPLRVTGTANTFEATFSYELTDTDGLIVAEDFVTATSGTGTRGTFDLTAPFTVKFDGVGSLIVFERSAKDGSRINLVEVPLRMSD